VILVSNGSSPRRISGPAHGACTAGTVSGSARKALDRLHIREEAHHIAIPAIRRTLLNSRSTARYGRGIRAAVVGDYLAQACATLAVSAIAFGVGCSAPA
jgi:uncharacterized protein with PIN domain